VRAETFRRAAGLGILAAGIGLGACGNDDTRSVILIADAGHSRIVQMDDMTGKGIRSDASTLRIVATGGSCASTT
jgi:hypothetical protein